MLNGVASAAKRRNISKIIVRCVAVDMVALCFLFPANYTGANLRKLPECPFASAFFGNGVALPCVVLVATPFALIDVILRLFEPAPPRNKRNTHTSIPEPVPLVARKRASLVDCQRGIADDFFALVGHDIALCIHRQATTRSRIWAIANFHER